MAVPKNCTQSAVKQCPNGSDGNIYLKNIWESLLPFPAWGTGNVSILLPTYLYFILLY
jgi:hypothetical protein